MYIIWFIIGALAILAFSTLETIVNYNVIKQLNVEEKKMRGKRWHYISASVVLPFVIISTISLGAINYVNAPNEFMCWVIPSIIISSMTGWMMSQRLNNMFFE